MEYLLVIAALCGSPSYGYSPAWVQSCQKYYLNCVNKKIKKNSSIMRQTALEECILEKK